MSTPKLSFFRSLQPPLKMRGTRSLSLFHVLDLDVPVPPVSTVQFQHRVVPSSWHLHPSERMPALRVSPGRVQCAAVSTIPINQPLHHLVLNTWLQHWLGCENPYVL
jgi:hypothetical protein